MPGLRQAHRRRPRAGRQHVTGCPRQRQLPSRGCRRRPPPSSAHLRLNMVRELPRWHRHPDMLSRTVINTQDSRPRSRALPNIRGSLRSGVWAAAGTDRPVRGIPGLAWDRPFDRAPGRVAFRWILRPAFGEVVRFSSAGFSEPAVDQGREACAGSASGNGTRDRRRGCFRGRPPEAAAGPAAGPPQPGGGVPGSSGCRALARGLLACTAARLPRMAAGAARQSPLRSGPGRSARLCGGARPRSPGTCGDRGRHAPLPAGRRRRLRETPVTPITQYQREPDRRPGGGAQIRPSAVPGQHAQAGVVALLDHRG